MPIAYKDVKRVSPESVRSNPENPRLIFRQDELDSLANSIRQLGILVPLTVYEKPTGRGFVLIDGERRWKCAKKLNLSEVPVIIEPKPTKLENILRMFNIHNVRIQWDLLAVALKLQDIQELLAAQNRPNSPKDVATLTGLTMSTVRRALDLLTMPKRYRSMLFRELEKAKSEQKFSEDLFIEMMKAIRVIERYAPQVSKQYPRDRMIEAFFSKYKTDVIRNVVAFRKVSRIARGERAGITKEHTLPVLRKLFSDPEYTIEGAYAESVMFAYEERELLAAIEALTAKLERTTSHNLGSDDLKQSLRRLNSAISRVLNTPS